MNSDENNIARQKFAERFPDATPLPPAEGTPKKRVGFDIDEILVTCTEPYDYRADPASYTRLPLFAVFAALAMDPSFEIFVITGRLRVSVPKEITEITEWVDVMRPGCQLALICREWDHPVDHLTPADKAWKDENLKVCSKYCDWERKLARQFCHVR